MVSDSLLELLQKLLSTGDMFRRLGWILLGLWVGRRWHGHFAPMYIPILYTLTLQFPALVEMERYLDHDRGGHGVAVLLRGLKFPGADCRDRFFIEAQSKWSYDLYVSGRARGVDSQAHDDRTLVSSFARRIGVFRVRLVGDMRRRCPARLAGIHSSVRRGLARWFTFLFGEVGTPIAGHDVRHRVRAGEKDSAHRRRD